MDARLMCSLGAALLGAAPAPGYEDPGQDIPGAWVTLFRTRHADRPVYTGLFRSCRAGRGWVVTTAPNALLHVSTAPGTSLSTWRLKQETAAQRAALRGTLPTVLDVQVYGLEYSVAALDSLPVILSNTGPHFTGLTVRAGSVCEVLDTVRAGDAITRFLGSAVFPSVTHMQLDVPCHFTLPAPSHFPNMAHLTLAIPTGRPQASAYGLGAQAGNAPLTFLASLKPYISQLQTLHVQNVCSESDHWPALFRHDAQAHALTSLVTDGPLTGSLVGRLVDHAPMLRTLHVRDIQLYENVGYAQREWGVELLSTEGVWGGVVKAVHVAGLPRRTTGSTQLSALVLHLTNISEQGLEPASIRSRLSEWRFNVARIVVAPNRLLPTNKHLAALTTTLQQLHSLQATADVVDLRYWCWDAQLAAAAAAALPALPHLRFGVHVATLTDELLRAVLAIGPHVRCVSTDKLQLQSDAHTDTPWPWEELRVYKGATAEQLLRLPNPAQRAQPDQGPPMVHVFGTLDTRSVREAGTTAQLRDWIASVRWEGSAVDV